MLEVRHLDVGYRVPGAGLFAAPRVLPIVRDVSFTLPPGRTIGVVGESGCGKSTLGRALIRLIAPTSGQVLWQGQDLATLPARDLRVLRAELQIIFQDPVAALDPRMTLGRIVSRPLATFEPGLSRRVLAERAVEALRAVGLSADFAARYPHELSGGQAQRVGIARALIGGPKLLVCDEPVSALDVSIQAQVVNLLMDLQADMGLGLVFISHNLAVVRHISHQIMVMCLGRVVELAPRDAFYARPLHPYSRALMEAVPEPDPRREKGRVGTALEGGVAIRAEPTQGLRFRLALRAGCGKMPERTARIAGFWWAASGLSSGGGLEWISRRWHGTGPRCRRSPTSMPVVTGRWGFSAWPGRMMWRKFTPCAPMAPPRLCSKPGG